MGGEPGRAVWALIKVLVGRGWTYKSSNPRAHPAGVIKCGKGCQKSIWSSPKAGDEEQVKRIKAYVKRCPHGRRVTGL